MTIATTTYKNLIGGRWVDAKSGATFDSVSPANHEELIGTFPASSAADRRANARGFPTRSTSRADVQVRLAEENDDDAHDEDGVGRSDSGGIGDWSCRMRPVRTRQSGAGSEPDVSRGAGTCWASRDHVQDESRSCKDRR